MGGQTRAAFDEFFKNYEQQRESAQMRMMMAQTQEEQNAARMAMNQAEYYFLNNLKQKQKGLRTEILINRGLIKAMQSVLQKYAPELLQSKTPVEGNNPTIINTTKDSTDKDTTK
jgi:hypothetical protein